MHLYDIYLHILQLRKNDNFHCVNFVQQKFLELFFVKGKTYMKRFQLFIKERGRLFKF